ncbi:MAG: hypothetical protein HRU11_08920 [Parvularculaceae bacterium]|nr:hypothetical protein [Parvularculaceae bacterium]
MLNRLAQRTSSWMLLAAGWLLVVAMPFRVPAETDTVAVVFPPWMDQTQQFEALIAANLFVLERRGPLTLIGFATDGAIDAPSLRSRGALLVLDQTSLALCRTPRSSSTTSSSVGSR